jgi:uncharacterized protein (TIGR02996 family)
MNNRAKDFLAQIVAQPEEDTPRLIYADWLDEEGDVARAEFIRVQTERARLPAWDARQVKLRLREHALLKQHEGPWKAELPDVEGVKWGEFRRGFVATAAFASFVGFGERMSACHAVTPIEAATVHWPRQSEAVKNIAPIPGLRELSITAQVVDYGDVQRLADAPLLSTLRVLNLYKCSIGGDSFRRLVASPHVGNLTTLRAPGNAIGAAAVSALFATKSLKSLTELDLSETGSYGRTRLYGRYREDRVLEAVDLRALAGWPGMARLRVLTLSGNSVGRDGLQALLRSRHAVGLKALTLRGNGLDGQAMQEFGAARPELQLDVLDLGDNLLRDLGPADLALAACLKELKVLELDRCEIALSGARWLVNAPFRASLRCLNVSHNTFGPEGLFRLLEKKPPFLHTLQMVDNDLGDEGAAHLAESPNTNALLDVNFAQNKLGDAAAKYLGKTKHLKGLLILRLNNNSFTQAAASALAATPMGERLAFLKLSHKDETPF